MQKPSNSTLLNICVIPNKQVSKECVTISQSLGEDTTMFMLGNGKFAHMTVFMARFADNRISEVIDAVSETLKLCSPFHCEHTGYFMTEGRYLEVSYRKSSAFLALHESLIEQIAPFRINPGSPYEESYFAPYTAAQQRNAKETGYDLARELYRPHITLTRYKEGKVPEKFPAFPETVLSFNLDKVCVYEADDNGAVFRLLKEFVVR